MILETRLPLQTGATMLKRVTVAAACIDGACALVQLRGFDQVQFPLYWLYFAPITAVILMRLIGSARASDCVFDPDELRIDGGKYDGFRMAWKSIRNPVFDQGALRLDLGSGVTVPVATASDAHEQRSIEALRQSILQRTAEEAPPAHAAPTDARVVTCPSCGGPLALDDRDVVACPHCGASAPVPEPMRERIRAARSLRQERAAVDRLVERLLNQPSARRVNGLLAGTAAIAIVWLPAPLMVGSRLMGPMSALAALLLALAAYAVIADRRAVGLLTLDFASRAPEKEGAPERCRRCGSPLPRSDDAVIATCVYCEAENVLGIDLRADVRTARSSETTLEQALSERARSRTIARLVALVGSIIVLGLAVFLARW
ncbi:MAG TPA: hypothetical protein VMI75_09670 [Polyangiaceae bacterium]|nr:hypothetical protein [Polyangiaceae bacterium]